MLVSNFFPTFWQFGSHRDMAKQEQRFKNNIEKSSGTCSLRCKVKWMKNVNRLNQQKSKHLVKFCIHIFVTHGKTGGVGQLCSLTAGVAAVVLNVASRTSTGPSCGTLHCHPHLPHFIQSHNTTQPIPCVCANNTTETDTSQPEYFSRPPTLTPPRKMRSHPQGSFSYLFYT